MTAKIAFCCACAFCSVVALVVLIFIALLPAAVCAFNEPSHAGVLIDDLGGSKFTLDNMTVLPPPDLYARLREELWDNWTHEASGYTYGMASVHEAPLLLYNGTKIAGNWERTPPAVRGVFWMKNNGVPEILATLQYGEYFEEERILLFPNAPFSWTWFGGASPPSRAHVEMNHIYDVLEAKGLAEAQGEGNITVAVSFKPCPPGASCVAGSDNFTFADIQSHSDGNLTSASTMTQFVTWTMEEMNGVEPYSLWNRRVSVYCDAVGFGSYTLTKIIDENGHRIEPYYSDYVDYMEGNPHILWSGFGPGHHLE